MQALQRRKSFPEIWEKVNRVENLRVFSCRQRVGHACRATYYLGDAASALSSCIACGANV